MKKLGCFAISALLLLCLGACGAPKESAPTDPATPAASAAPTEAELHELFDRNLVCWLDIYGLNTLDYDPDIYQDTLHKVTDERFPTWDALEEFTRQTYQTPVAEELLFQPRFEEHRLYQEVDGCLCVDEYVMGGMGYYVDWSDYQLSIDDCSDTECHFTLTAVQEDPEQDMQQVPFTCQATAVCQDGAWVLTEMVY